MHDRWGDRVEWFGPDGAVDTSSSSRVLAWRLDGVYVMANMWWEPLEFVVQSGEGWIHAVDTFDPTGEGTGEVVAAPVVVGPRSVVVLTRAPDL